LDFDLSDKSILLAEDNEMNQMLIEVMLKPTGVKLLLAETGREAVDMVRKHKVDLVLMDIQMPEMDGIEATKIIRQDLEMSVPIVALTAKSFKGSEQEYKQKGMNDFIPKPIDEHRFSETLARLLDIEYMNGTELDEPAQVSRKQKLDYSLDRIERGCNYNRTTVVRILGKFIEQGSQTTLEIREALAEKDLKRIRNLSHRIKSSLDTMDVHYLSRLANEIERMESLKSQINRSKIIEFCQGVDDLISLLRNESIDSNDAEI
jgi:CheY-like chemotaxis protein/HPt (histidine-containing phosphotransfer) domain-containing protein